MLEALLDAFRKTVTISASREAVTFACGETTLTAKPILLIAPDGRILGIGDPAREGNNEGRAVPVFTSPIDHERLVAFLRRGLVAIGMSPFSVSPRVTMSGMNDLRPALGPGGDAALEKALVGAGAGTVELTP